MTTRALVCIVKDNQFRAVWYLDMDGGPEVTGLWVLDCLRDERSKDNYKSLEAAAANAVFNAPPEGKEHIGLMPVWYPSNADWIYIVDLDQMILRVSDSSLMKDFSNPRPPFIVLINLNNLPENDDFLKRIDQEMNLEKDK